MEDARLKEIAKNVIWFEKPEEALKNVDKFLCYVMKYGLLEDVAYTMDKYGALRFRKALNSIYNSMIDDRSRAYFENRIKELIE